MLHLLWRQIIDHPSAQRSDRAGLGGEAARGARASARHTMACLTSTAKSKGVLLSVYATTPHLASRDSRLARPGSGASWLSSPHLWALPLQRV